MHSRNKPEKPVRGISIDDLFWAQSIVAWWQIDDDDRWCAGQRSSSRWRSSHDICARNWVVTGEYVLHT